MAEKALEFVGRTTGLPYSILRVSNASGRWQTSNVQGIVGIALRSVRDGSPVQLFGGGGQVRDFVDADDAAEAILAACLSEHESSTWNVGSGKGISIVDLIKRISEIVGRPILISHAPPRKVDVPHLVLDCRKIARELNWTATTTLDQSIERCWHSIACASLPISRFAGLAPVFTGQTVQSRENS
jgi:UDP-glucose 4-epimerase